MNRYILLLVITTLSSLTFAGTLEVKSNVITYSVRSSDYRNFYYDTGIGKLNLIIEIGLVNGRLPNKTELESVSSEVLKSQPNAHMMWVFFLLPEMESGAGAYAIDHRVPISEGVEIMEYMLYNTPYEHLWSK